MTITPAEFLQAELDNGISADNPHFLQLAKQTANQLTIDFETVLDYGSGTGVYANAFQELGKDVKAFEIWNEHREYIRQKFPLVKIANEPITTDLMLFIEVAEHMTDDELIDTMDKICPNYILFSSTSSINPEFDKMWGHINIKQQNEWIDFWFGLGYNFIKDLTYPTSWSKLFKRIDE
jgi:2-polyprenyl-3-methyl-5-hydroxy-6-metoxy-1,4-benzoquinol methylase